MFNETPVFDDVPRYFPRIGHPDEMSPINDITYDYENNTPPVIEVTLDDDESDISQIKPPLANKLL
ncbi:hypothetical protein [Bacillus alveayuensis]|jgi:hypothetical protein|uniref:hypothetical protein n=1 Tax=Aeribacillus alveayuensis TaxID=279215 RepID=UPI0005CD4FA5|nr:hypothetical protein [Bacillus alveayuensis]